MTPMDPPPMTLAAPPPPGPDATLRGGLRRLSTGLIAYGVIGLIIAAIGLVLLLYVGNRAGQLADRASTQVETAIQTLDRASVALTDAGATASSFASTLAETPPAVQQAADTVGSLQSNLRAIEGQLGAVSVLGAQPLAGVASRFGAVATQLEGLDARLATIATSLSDNQGKLETNAGSLGALGAQLGSVADQLRTGVVQDSLADVQLLLTLFFLLLVIWTAVPAAGALWIGWWLRRDVGVRPASWA
jgi:hypothetical protein